MREGPDELLEAAQERFELGLPVDFEAVRLGLLRKSLAAGTLAQYDRWVAKFRAWLQQQGPPAEVSEAALADYLVYLFLAGKGGQVPGARAAICNAYPNLSDSLLVSRLAKGIEAQWRLAGGGRVQRDALPVHAVLQFASQCPAGLSPFDWTRDCLLAVVAIRTMRRPAEVLGLEMQHFKWDQDNNQRGWPWLQFVKAKNDRLGKHGKRFWLPLDPSNSPLTDIALLFRNWLSLRGLGAGPLFCTQQGAPLHSDYLSSLARRIADLAGVSGVFAGYSFRIAGATLAAAGGLSTAEIQAIGGWRSDAVHCYIRSLGSAVAGASGRMGL